MSYKDDELDLLLRNHRILTPAQHADMTRRAIARAHAYRTEAFRDLFRRLFGWIRRRAAVAQLQALDDRALKDIGLYRGDIETAVRGTRERAETRQLPEMRRAA